jgi:hypothetical protein
MEHARCKGEPTEMFFPGRGEPFAEALAICEACPVRVQCLEMALDFPERMGIWGGATEKERRQLRRLRQRGKRKTSKSVIAAKADRCPNTYPFTEANTYTTPKGYRRCRECHRERQRALNQSMRAG